MTRKNRKKARSYSLRTRLTATVLVCWTVPILLFWLVAGQLSESRLRSRMDDSLQEGAGFAAQQLMYTLDSIIALSRRASTDGVFYQQYQSGNPDTVGAYQETRASLNNTFVRNSDVIMAVLYYHGHEDSLIYYIDSRQHTASLLPEHTLAADCAGIQAAVPKESAYISFYQNEGRLYLIRNILDSDTFTPFATLALLLNAESLTKPFEHFGLSGEASAVRLADYLDNGPVYLTGSVIPLSNMPSGGERLWRDGNETHLARQIYSRDYTLAFHISADYNANFPEQRWAQILNLMLALGGVPLLAYMLRYLHRQVTSPIQALILVAGRLERQEFGVQTGPAGDSSEFQYLAGAFDQMSARLQELFERSYREELMLRDARIEALQSQINPHFFNNTLELINWQARRNGDEVTGRMVESLGTLVGAAIDRSDKPTVPLYEEMDGVDAYLYITKVRYGKRLSVSCEIDESLLDRPVPRLSLQPLLENAVVHGIENENEARLVIRVYRSDTADSSRMMVEIENSSPMSEGDRKAVDAILATGIGKLDESGKRRVGLANVYKRLMLLYNDTRVLQYRSDQHSTTFILSLPL